MTKQRRLELFRQALKLRQRYGIAADAPCDVYALADKLGLDVRFVDLNSVEGLYSSGRRSIAIPVGRPPGRRAYSCAHEIAHHVLNHPTGLLAEAPDSAAYNGRPAEMEAQWFAGCLLMPLKAVATGFTKRGWRPADCTPVQAYTVAGWLGVGYETLVSHGCWSLNLWGDDHRQALRRHTPKTIRPELLGEAVDGNLLMLDPAWMGRAADLETGDLVIAPRGCVIEGNQLEPLGEVPNGLLLRAARVGQARLTLSGDDWAVFVRVCRRGYCGRSVYRFLEEPDDEEEADVR